MQKKEIYLNEKIDAIEFFQINVNSPTHFSFGTIENRQTCMVRFIHGKYDGWAEIQAAKNNPDFNLKRWADFFKIFLNMTIADAFNHLQKKHNGWNWDVLELCEIALLDLTGKIIEKSAIEILGLAERNSVPGVFCILQDKPEKAAKMAETALVRNLKSHLKIKIFGDNSLDTQIIKAVRKIIPEETFLIGDANYGYGKNIKKISNELVDNLKNLYNIGLNACEDPAGMPNELWKELQSKVGNLNLIPDVPLRPAWTAIQNIIPDMGRIYNIHPACTGSIFYAVKLARKIQSFGAKLMIGDASLVGAACTVWQQLAIGLGADWVEAIEKPEESDVFSSCVLECSTAQMSDGKFGIKNLYPGFGLKINIDKLKKLSDNYCRL